MVTVTYVVMWVWCARGCGGTDRSSTAPPTCCCRPPSCSSTTCSETGTSPSRV